ncbi:calmodulin-binding receptor-like cytoplasmic kinase 3 isoform X2 [Elaeis guineensis]|uniref:calmodulin-binding receptor-like cytoplasmic kinase 3 isoform X2 n=1 Tax=Elaeis guineensis var. tenera TaxID=51953 RepID=UPI003C6CD239
MAHFILPLLILMQLPWCLLCESVPTLSKVCRFDHVAYSKSSDGYHLSINQERIEDPVLICEALETYFKSGCLLCDSQVESWRRIGKEYCRQDFNVPVNVKCNHISVDSVSSIEVGSTSGKIPTTPLRVPPSPSRFSLSPQLSTIGSVNLSINQIIKATQSFSPSLRLGEGGFGTVYKAVLPDGLIVAIKRAKKEHIPALRDEFSNEVELLAKIEHQNLVRLLGYTDKGNERIIITEYVPNGTLREHLDGQHGKILDFKQRLEIAIDVAHALTYLHLYAEKTIIHRDVKSSNILLTESYRAKVSDFGFARTGPSDTEQTHISTKVKGTAGYLDPEYLRTYQLTPKSDVFSFGILLIEILSGRRPVELKRGIDERITVRWAFHKYNVGNLRDILDPLLEEVVDEEVLGKMLSLAFQCAAPTRDDRPDMKEVGEQLWEIRREFRKSFSKSIK